MKKIGVIGSGSIGPDLAYGFASALAGTGMEVVLYDISQTQLDQGVARIRAYLKKGVDRGKISPKKAPLIEASLKPSLDIADLDGCFYVLEAATENLKLKQKILEQVEQVVSPDCLIGFATSGIPRRQIAATAKHPDRCFVNHPFFPAWRSLPIELVPSDDPLATQHMHDLLMRLGKIPIWTKDVHCFAADDIFCNYECEAFRLFEDGVATPAQIDRIVNEHIGGGGPFNVIDLTRGNLLIVHCQEMMLEANDGNPWFAPPKILLDQGDKTWLDPKNPGPSGYDAATAKTVMDRILAVLFARAFFVVEEEICSPGDFDWLARMALGFKKGILELAAEMGMEHVRDLCLAYQKAHPDFIVPECIQTASMPEFFHNIVIAGPDADGIATLLVRRPEVINALNRKTIDELSAAFDELDRDPAVRGIVFGGFGGGLAGADITELARLEDPEACIETARHGQALTRRIEAMSKPVVAAIDGPVLGGGAEMCMATWARVVGARALIGQPEVNLGIIPGYGGTQRLPRLVGIDRGTQLLRSGQPMTAQQACAWGWATGTPADHPFEQAKELIRKHLSGESPLQPMAQEAIAIDRLPDVDIGHRSLAIDAILRDVLEAGLQKPLPDGLEEEANAFGRCRLTLDLGIGMSNFMQNGPRVPAVFVNA